MRGTRRVSALRNALEPLLLARRGLPVRHRRITGIARSGDVVFGDQLLGQHGVHPNISRWSSQHQLHIRLGRVSAARHVRARRPSPARSAAGSAAAGASNQRAQPRFELGRPAAAATADRCCPARAVTPPARCSTSHQIVPPIDAEALQIEAPQRLPMRRAGVARVVDQRRVRAARAERAHHLAPAAPPRAAQTAPESSVPAAVSKIATQSAPASRLQRHVGGQQLAAAAR